MIRRGGELICLPSMSYPFETDEWIVGEGVDTLGRTTYVVHRAEPYFICQYALAGEAPDAVKVIYSEDGWVFYDLLLFLPNDVSPRDLHSLLHEAALAIARHPL